MHVTPHPGDAHSPEDTRQYVGTLLIATAGGGKVSPGVSWVGARDAVKHPAIDRTAPPEQRMFQNVSSAEVESLSSDSQIPMVFTSATPLG